VTGRRLLLIAAALLGVAWLVASPGGVPLYDGVGFPDEPYRYVNPPAGAAATKPASTGKVVTVVRNGRSDPLTVYTAEQGPQAWLYVPGGGLAAPAATSTVTLTLTPLAPTPPASDGTILGNAYQVTATGPNGPVQLSASGKNQAQLLLRAPKAEARLPALEMFTDGHWTALPSDRFGNDIYGGYIPAFGKFALVRLNHAAATAAKSAGTSGGGSGLQMALLVIGIVIVALAVIIGFVRLRRLRTAAD
jgi:hypothetical protein